MADDNERSPEYVHLMERFIREEFPSMAAYQLGGVTTELRLGPVDIWLIICCIQGTIHGDSEMHSDMVNQLTTLGHNLSGIFSGAARATESRVGYRRDLHAVLLPSEA